VCRDRRVLGLGDRKTTTYLWIRNLGFESLSPSETASNRHSDSRSVCRFFVSNTLIFYPTNTLRCLEHRYAGEVLQAQDRPTYLTARTLTPLAGTCQAPVFARCRRLAPRSTIRPPNALLIREDSVLARGFKGLFTRSTTSAPKMDTGPPGRITGRLSRRQYCDDAENAEVDHEYSLPLDRTCPFCYK
jgi:hypothetical protein